MECAGNEASSIYLSLYVGNHDAFIRHGDCFTSGHGATPVSRICKLSSVRRCWSRQCPLVWQTQGKFAQALSKQKDELLTSFQAHVAGHEAQHNAEREGWRAEIAALRAKMAQLRGVDEARDRQPRSTHIMMKGLAEQPVEQLTPAVMGQHIPGTEHSKVRREMSLIMSATSIARPKACKPAKLGKVMPVSYWPLEAPLLMAKYFLSIQLCGRMRRCVLQLVSVQLLERTRRCMLQLLAVREGMYAASRNLVREAVRAERDTMAERLLQTL